jgi:tryptophanyl-tRNA synthetase
MLVDIAVAKLAPISTEMAQLMRDPAAIDQVLKDGADRAGKIAAPILEKTYNIVGMLKS